MKKLFSLLLLLFFVSCEPIGLKLNRPIPKINVFELQRKARSVLINYTYSKDPLLRSHAIESLAKSKQVSTIDVILSGLEDDYWGVRFTSALAIMELKYDKAKPILLRKIKQEKNKSVKIAISATLHSMGDERFTSLIGQGLFDRTDPIVRRNAALVLGRLGQKGAIKILRSALRDDDISVRLQVLEALTLLGNTRAQRLMLDSYLRSYYDDERILAILALANAKVVEAKPPIIKIFDESKSRSRLGMKLISARALAMLGDFRGRETALDALDYKDKDKSKQTLIRKLAALALAEMPQDNYTLYKLSRKLTDPNPDVRIASAFAILKSTTEF